ncbi:hypothetical protein RQP53_20225 [Paucibacter sp. APW11]|uniref:Uncharacterized protein n=1 Tax=Roseateles aquae TaxID=3077235 RepID=A0ABU3PGA2_9BURK|nr:hypothetical protein [Paucibacter sp. APW11]MDT9001615.1 hypothetical protein [Paucibacter sp. APW11]
MDATKNLTQSIAEQAEQLAGPQALPLELLKLVGGGDGTPAQLNQTADPITLPKGTW